MSRGSTSAEDMALASAKKSSRPFPQSSTPARAFLRHTKTPTHVLGTCMRTSLYDLLEQWAHEKSWMQKGSKRGSERLSWASKVLGSLRPRGFFFCPGATYSEFSR